LLLRTHQRCRALTRQLLRPLLGGFSTYWFQLRAAKQTGVAARQERLRQDQLVACSEFAAAVTDLRRALIAVWFRQGRKNRAVADRAQAVAEYYTAQAEADRLGAAALGAKFRMLLVLDDPGLRGLADEAFRQLDAIDSAVDKAAVEALDMDFEAHMSTFVATAAKFLI
jgi:hypothetical protein